jgi:23S rRNA (adenine2503-C2)-methyltransferase
MKLKEIEKFLAEKRIPRFRFKQIRDAFFKQSLSSFKEITNLPQDLRNELTEKFAWFLVKPVKSRGSLEQGVVKTLLELEDGLKIESVLMFYRDWISACLSVMVGCPLGCGFCATGNLGFKRNLTASEIVDQVVYWNQILKGQGERVNNLVFMGMGEPFLNWDNVWEALQTINDPDGLGIGQRHITLSTAGVVPGIKKLADLETQINLAISLHSPFQEKREKVMPIAKKYSLNELFEAAQYYVQKTNRKLFFEYALISGFNDRPEDAAELKKLFTDHLFHLNLINLNPTDSKLTASSQKRLAEFTKLLDEYHIPYTLRRSVGGEIQAACGQLAGEE